MVEIMTISNTDLFKTLMSRKKGYIQELGVLLDCQMGAGLNKEAMATARTDYNLHEAEFIDME